VESVAFSPDGRLALSGGAGLRGGGELVLWEVGTGQEARRLPARGFVESVAFSPDGRLALSGGSSDFFGIAGELILWEVGTGQEARRLPARGPVRSVAFFPDGCLALSGGAGLRGVGELVLWEVGTGQEARRLSARRAVNSVAFSPDGPLALSGGGDFRGGGELVLWDFGRVERYRTFKVKLAAVPQALQANPKDAPSLNVLGEWYAFRGQLDWAIDFLERARRRGGTDVSALTLARCYWERSTRRPWGQNHQVGGALASSPAGPLRALPSLVLWKKEVDRSEADLRTARRELRRALERQEAPEPYLNLCLQAVERELR
jgi:WD40 repeat protein